MELEVKGGTVLIDDWQYYNISKYRWYIDNNGYAQSFFNKKITSMHRFILGITDPKIICDHINKNRLDNRLSNLRITDNKNNSRNTSSRKNALSKYLGVSFQYPNKYRYIKAKIRVDGKLIHLGTFKTEEDAALAYNNAAIKYFGEYASLNTL